MTRMTATEARRQLFKLLDAVEGGDEVVLERRGVRFRLTLDRRDRAEEVLPESPLVVTDPDILDAEWGWKTDAHGQLVFALRDRSD